MPFCSKCGNEIKNDDAFCPVCGTPNRFSEQEISTNTNEKQDFARYKTDVSSGGTYGLDIRDLPQGTKLEDERYTILEKLGEGGFGVVYKASDSNYEGDLKALKVIYSENYSDRLVMHKLKSEARNMIKINHPNVVRLYDIHFQGEMKFLDMEYVDGGDLVGLMLKCPDYKIAEDKVWDLAIQIAKGMQAIHKQNLIHQDLKPENILLTNDGQVKITDFGISEHFRSSKSRIEETNIKGTYVYASPEQLIGENVGKEADVWSFGTTLYHILTGETLYSGNTSGDVITQIKLRSFQSVANVSEKMNYLLSKCLKRDYKERFRSFGHILEFVSKSNEQRRKVPQPLKSFNQLNQEKKNSETDDSMQTATSIKLVSSNSKLNDDKNLKKNKILKKKTKKLNKELTKYLYLIFLGIISVGTIYYFGMKYVNKEPKLIKIEGLSEDSTMVFVQGGTFQMGSNNMGHDERPVHSVTIDDFYINKYEVTQAEYQGLIGENPSYHKGDYYPVEQLSWFDAVEFCNKKSKREGLTPCYTGSGSNIVCNFDANGYRLPTEAEWEYAARGGNKSEGYQYSGSDQIEIVAWYVSNSDDKTSPVGQKMSNELGIYDMSGNVWEWCWDWYDSGYYSGSNDDNPTGPSHQSCRILRSGCWSFSSEGCRVSNRGYYSPIRSDFDIGFRLARKP